MNKIEICSISISICAVFVSLLINSSYAQSEDNFKTYSNNDLNFTIQYPSNWQVEEDRSPRDSVWFRIPDRDYGSFFSVSVKNIEPYLDTGTMTLKNTSLQQYAQQALDIDISTFKNKLLRQNEVTVGGNTGIKHELETTYTVGFNIYTIANGKFYILSYADEPLKVPDTLPLANKVVESFQIKG